MCFCAAKRITDQIKDDALPSGTRQSLRRIGMIFCRETEIYFGASPPMDEFNPI
jgi:hypothetical protein